ncbi:MAG TPA: hypothetical protein DEH05_07830, partial [Propionibacteriaceae bacterium]|nr:hypothetical protein [Propionibacteriaceae bacterium]
KAEGGGRAEIARTRRAGEMASRGNPRRRILGTSGRWMMVLIAATKVVGVSQNGERAIQVTRV